MSRLSVGALAAERLGVDPSELLKRSWIVGHLDMGPFIEEVMPATRIWHIAFDRAATQRALAQESWSAAQQFAGWPQEDLEQKFVDAARKLADFGWTIPDAVIPREFFDISTIE